MVTIILPVSRDDFLVRVISGLELLDCNPKTTNILCIVDGSDELYVKTRNLIADTKFNNRLTVRSSSPTEAPRINIQERRRRICAIHNQARQLISQDGLLDYVFLCEDDTTFKPDTLKKLLDAAISKSAIGFIEGVELGRWGTPYVGAWLADDIYNTKKITSVDNEYREGNRSVESIDAGGFYCALVKASLYKNHFFSSENGLGPDVNFGLELRRAGYENYVHWGVPCDHHSMKLKKHEIITMEDEAKTVTMTYRHRSTWHISS